MKYSEQKNENGKFSAGFYIIIAICLIIIGGATYFALTSGKNKNMSPKMETPQNKSYTDDTPSYTESTEQPDMMPETSEITGQSVSDVPYSEEPEQPPAPLFVMPVEGEVIKGYDEKQLQYSATYGDLRIHKGTDISCKIGTSVSACLDGTVTEIINDSNLGNGVAIESVGGITVKYFALDGIKVKENDSVKAGDIIGTSASIPSECADKPHIHIEVYKDNALFDFSGIINR